MVYKPKTIEEFILSLLGKGSLGTHELLKKIQEKRAGTSKQALYQILRKLKDEEVVVMRSKQVSLSHLWINKMAEYFSTAQRFYSTQESGEDFLDLEDGDRISYSFKSPEHADTFWGHAFGILAELTPSNEATCIYNPHEWFMIARHESEKILFDEIKNNGKQLFVLVGNTDPLDEHIRNEFDGDKTQYHTTKEKMLRKETYLNIFGDFIIEATLGEETEKEIDALYKQTKVFDESVRSRLKEIVTQKGKTKLTISRNKRKAEKYKRVFKKYFYIRN